MELKLLNNSIIASQDEKGTWIYKANEQTPFKRNGVLKKEYKDLPRFKAIVEYENEEVKDFNTLLEQSVKEVTQKLLSFSNNINHI